MDSPATATATAAQQPPRLNAMQSMMANGAKGAALTNLVTSGYLKGLFSVGKQFNKDCHWKMQCLLCQNFISTGECRAQNLLIHLARAHVESIDSSVMKEVIKSLVKSEEKDEKPSQPISSAKRLHAPDHTEIDPQRLKRVLAEWLIADGLPFHALEGRGFHQLVTLLRPDLEYPGRQTVLKELPLMVVDLQSVLRKEMETAVAVSIQLDFWSASDGDRSGFMSVNTTFINRLLKFCEATLAMEYVPGKHDGKTTAHYLELVINRFGITAPQIGAITTDDGSSMAPGIAEFFKMPNFQLGGLSAEMNSQRHLRCLGHVINLVWTDACKEIKANDKGRERSVTLLFTIVDKVRKLIFYYAQSSQRRAALQAACILLQIVAKAILFPVATRWFSEVYMISRANDLGKALLKVTAKDMNLSGAAATKYREILSHFQGILHLLPPLVEIGREWEKWQSLLSAGNEVTISRYPEAVRQILLSVSSEKEAQARETSEEVAQIIHDLRESVMKRFGDFPLIALAAELLDPLTTHRANGWPAEMRPNVTNFLFAWMDALAPPLASSTNSKWGPELSASVLENSRNVSNWAELSRVGKQLDAFNIALLSSPERMAVRNPPPHPCCEYSVALKLTP